MKCLDYKFKMNSRLLPAIFILFSLGIDHVHCAVCQAVVDCENQYVPLMRDVGHDKSAYCSEVSKMILCLQKKDCLGETANHKTNLLRTFQNDPSCSDGTRLSSNGCILFFLPIFILWTLWNRFIL